IGGPTVRGSGVCDHFLPLRLLGRCGLRLGDGHLGRIAEGPFAQSDRSRTAEQGKPQEHEDDGPRPRPLSRAAGRSLVLAERPVDVIADRFHALPRSPHLARAREKSRRIQGTRRLVSYWFMTALSGLGGKAGSVFFPRT